jgi:phage antirepressor YoqD-like protein
VNDLSVIDHKGQRVLTTQQLAEKYETEPQVITNNFNRNKERYQIGIHYFILEGQDLKGFRATNQFDFSLNLNKLYLWTEKGCLFHAKSLGTDKAWEVYEMLVDTYFRVKESKFQIPQTLSEALRLAADMAEQNESLKLETAQQKQIICELQPKATYYDLILQSKAAIAISQIAKDYGMSATKMNELLHDLGVQYRQSDTWLLYQKYAGFGYTSSKTHDYINSKSEPCSRLHTYWTQKGRLFIYETLKNRKGILPLIEREGVLNAANQATG